MEKKQTKNHLGYDTRMSRLKTSSEVEIQVANNPKDVVCDRPELGLYDTRVWDRSYQQYIKYQTNHPGKHPDPECIWNTNEE